MIDWQSIIGPDAPILETVFRGTIMYFVLLLLMRLNKREAGEIGLADVMVIVVIADAAQNAMSGEYNSILSGIILVATIVFWDYAIDWMSYHFPALDRMMRPKVVDLIKKGRIHAPGLRSEMMTRGELMEQLRIAGVDDIKKVRSARMESNGKISVIKYKD
jgi:uncharacterized membrane protein YcaP (DUF421 family)